MNGCVDTSSRPLYIRVKLEPLRSQFDLGKNKNKKRSSLSIVYKDKMMCDDCILLVEIESNFLSNLSAQGFLTVNEPQRTSLQYVKRRDNDDIVEEKVEM